MQIDFHHAVIYILARLAKFGRRQSEVLSYCSQHVNDATHTSIIHFNDKTKYHSIASSHRLLDINDKNHPCWIPFHYIPGNCGFEADKKAMNNVAMICKADSHVAREMIKACIEEQDKPYALHRFGVALHAFADTWAHQEFSGIGTHKTNIVKIIDCNMPLQNSDNKSITREHGMAHDYPDIPYLSWSYTNASGKKIVRDNVSIYMEAAQRIYEVMRQFQAGNPKAKIKPLPKCTLELIESCLREFTHENAIDRYERWFERILGGSFGFHTPAMVSYIPNGRDSWRHKALGITEETDERILKNRKSFATSNWKLFHDGAKAHQNSMLNHILPQFGISNSAEAL